MRAKKPTIKPRSIRYLLSADRRLQKISLRKLSERLKKANPQLSSTQPKNAAAAKQPELPPRAYSWRAIVVGMTCVIAAAALMTARQPSEDADAGGAEPPPAASAPLANVAMAAPPATTKTAASKPVTPSATKPVAAGTTKQVTAGTTKPAAPTAAGMPAAHVSKATTQTVEPATAPVTITGCLEQDGDAFWLKDTSGAGAPKSRSWRTGFLKKRASRIELVDAGNILKLSSHVGERVAASGTLVDREMRARSLRRVAASCN